MNEQIFLGAKMNRPAPVEITYDCLRFLITHNPTNAQLGKFIEVGNAQIIPTSLWSLSFQVDKTVRTTCVGVQDLKAYGVNTLVRVCAATYDKTPVEQEGIQVLVRPGELCWVVLCAATWERKWLQPRKMRVISNQRSGSKFSTLQSVAINSHKNEQNCSFFVSSFKDWTPGLFCKHVQCVSKVVLS